VIDLAVGVIIGAAFTAIVDSLVKDIFTPLLGMIGGQPDFSAIRPGGVAVGKFVNEIISFLIKAAALYVFIVVPVNRLMARAASPATPAPTRPTPTDSLLIEIRDLLKTRAR
jgi:large conductance mechanosensitive channel